MFELDPDPAVERQGAGDGAADVAIGAVEAQERGVAERARRQAQVGFALCGEAAQRVDPQQVLRGWSEEDVAADGDRREVRLTGVGRWNPRKLRRTRSTERPLS